MGVTIIVPCSRRKELGFPFDYFLCICTFSEILMSNNSTIALLPYSYILCMNGILLDGIFMDFELTYV